MENLKKIFNSYNGYYEKLENENRKRINEINQLLHDETCDEEIKNKLKIKIDRIQINHNSITKDIENSLDNFMKNLPESPLSLPIKLKILIERKNYLIENLLLNPTDSVDKLIEIVRNFFINKGDEIKEIGESSFYFIKKFIVSDAELKFKEIEKETKIEPDSKFLSWNLNQGEIIVFKGNYILRSEVPKNCITYQFEKNINTKVKYFSCENWLCESCVESCHKQHIVKIHRENHIATWACCYCYRNKCIIKNNKN